jgi:outer membrane protein OmpA-like peptidoglycan-associated protein
MKDTDKGGVDDGTEVGKNQNPLDGTDDFGKKTLGPTEVGMKIVLEGVVFETGKSRLTPQSEEILIQAYETMANYPTIEVLISGHTDNAGKRDKNIKLSLDRANAVKAWLVAKGIPEARMSTAGYGPDQPIAPNDTPENMQKNRRIEFQRTK